MCTHVCLSVRKCIMCAVFMEVRRKYPEPLYLELWAVMSQPIQAETQMEIPCESSECS